MDSGWFKTIREEWPTLRTAPWSFGAISVIALGIGFGVATLWWSGTVSTLRERLSFAQDKLQTALAHPENPAAALVTKPEDKGRHLTHHEKECLISRFKDTTKDFIGIIITTFPDDDSQNYAKEFVTLFIRMGYQSGVIVGMPKNYEDTGLIVGMKDPDHPSDAAKKFKEFVGSCITLHDRTLVWTPPPNLLPQIASVDFNLFVGPID